MEQRMSVMIIWMRVLKHIFVNSILYCKEWLDCTFLSFVDTYVLSVFFFFEKIISYRFAAFNFYYNLILYGYNKIPYDPVILFKWCQDIFIFLKNLMHPIGQVYFKWI